MSFQDDCEDKNEHAASGDANEVPVARTGAAPMSFEYFDPSVTYADETVVYPTAVCDPTHAEVTK